MDTHFPFPFPPAFPPAFPPGINPSFGASTVNPSSMQPVVPEKDHHFRSPDDCEENETLYINNISGKAKERDVRSLLQRVCRSHVHNAFHNRFSGVSVLVLSW